MAQLKQQKQNLKIQTKRLTVHKRMTEEKIPSNLLCVSFNEKKQHEFMLNSWILSFYFNIVWNFNTLRLFNYFLYFYTSSFIIKTFNNQGIINLRWCLIHINPRLTIMWSFLSFWVSECGSRRFELCSSEFPSKGQKEPQVWTSEGPGATCCVRCHPIDSGSNRNCNGKLNSDCITLIYWSFGPFNASACNTSA